MRIIFGNFDQPMRSRRLAFWCLLSVAQTGVALAQPAASAPPPPGTSDPVAPMPPGASAPAVPSASPATPAASVPASDATPASPEQVPVRDPSPPVPTLAVPPAAEPAAEPLPPSGASQFELAPPPVEPIRLQPPAENSPVAPAPVEIAWHERLRASAFVDGYFGLNYRTPKPQDGRNRFRAYDSANGFGLAVAGLDVTFSGEQFGGTVALRFGPTARTIARADAEIGLAPLKQAYATWRPGGERGAVTLDFGKFDTIYGAEVAESQLNFNYTRGLVNWLAHPAFHTGLRATAEFNPQFWLTALVVNGWNNSYDNNFMKSFGLQLSTSMPNASDPDGAALMDAHVGYLVGPEQDDFGYHDCVPAGTTYDPNANTCNQAFPENSSSIPRDAGKANNPEAFKHLVDLVVGVNPSRDLALLFNGDVGFEGARAGELSADVLDGFKSQLWWGVAVMARYQLDPAWALALRGEVYGDPDGRATSGDDPYVQNVAELQLYSATLTVELVPVSNLVLRLDNRLDFANEDVYPGQLRRYDSLQATSTLGVVVTSE